MRVLLKCTMPVEAANRALKDGSLKKTIDQLAERTKPEAMYFATDGGRRTAFVVFDLKETSDMPFISEPLFSTLDAEVTYTPVMNREDLQAGLQKAFPR